MNELILLVNRALRRWWLHRIFDASVLATGVAAATVAVFHVSRLAGAPLGISYGSLVLAACGFAVVVFIAHIGASIARAPTSVEIAAWFDRHHALYERLSTAVEIQRHNHVEHPLVARAVLEDASRNVAAVRVNEVLRYRAPRAWWVTLALTAMAVAGAAMPSHQLVSQPPGLPVAQQMVSDQLVERAAVTAERVARYLTDDVRAARDPYLRAVAESLQEFASRVEGGAVRGKEAQREFEALFDHLQRAVEKNEDLAALLAHALNRAQGTSDESPPGPTPSPDTGIGHDEGEHAATTARDRTSPSSELERLLDELQVALDGADTSTVDRPPNQIGIHVGSDLDYAMAPPEERPQSTGLLQDGEAAGAPVGAAEESSDAPGDAAGEGAQTVDPDSAALSLGSSDADEDVLLPNTEDHADGRRISVDGLPGTSEHAGPRRGGADLDRPLPIHRVDEGGVTRDALEAAHRDVVTRYFLPDQREQRSDP